MGASTHTFLALGPRAKLQAASIKPELDRTPDLGYYGTYAGTVCSSMRAIRIWYQHHDKAGIAGGARDTQFPDFYFLSPKVSSLKQQASSSEAQASSFKPQAASSRTTAPS